MSPLRSMPSPSPVPGPLDMELDMRKRIATGKPYRATYDPRILASVGNPLGAGIAETPSNNKHPAIEAYRKAHPRRGLIYFGPYILLQTLGEGEFGKVKLGIHKDSYEEVAVKLIRRLNLNGEARHAKVEREIDVLRIVHHPNIVYLNDVIETEKYIGIILDFAKGGELFDHILAHRHLKEADAAKLFAQLVSGVHYLHQKKIVHRDLKLENLLLDRNRNIIITDFGFANRFTDQQDDSMATSCGSPCYAAPELVISEGVYAGSAVDIWSCGVILYAMLSGYLPFDDDPANPDGDNINLLYRYIVATPLTFPQHLSTQVRDLLSKMLVPNPKDRCDMNVIIAHPWLRDHFPLLSSSAPQLEAIARQARSANHRSLTRSHENQASHLDSRRAGRSGCTSSAEAQSERVELPMDRVDVDQTDKTQDSLASRTFSNDEVSSNREIQNGKQPFPSPRKPPQSDQRRSHTAKPADLHDRRTDSGVLIEMSVQDVEEASDVRPAFLPRQNRHTIQLEYVESVRRYSPADPPAARQSCVEEVSEEKTVSVNTIGPTRNQEQIMYRSAEGFQTMGGLATQEDVHGIPSQQITIAAVCERHASGSNLALDAKKSAVPRLKSNPTASLPIGEVQAVGAVDSATPLLERTYDPDSARLPPEERLKETRVVPATDPDSKAIARGEYDSAKTGGMQPSTSAAKRVMDWFRRKNRKNVAPASPKPSLPSQARLTESTETTFVANATTAGSQPEVNRSQLMRANGDERSSRRPQTFYHTSETRPMSGSSGKPSNDLALHFGLIDQSALTTKQPEAVMKLVAAALGEMNVQVKWETEYRLKCVRNPSLENIEDQKKTSTIRERMNRRLSAGLQSSARTSTSPTDGRPIHKHVEEVAFSVELTRLQNLPGLLSLDLKRLKGNIWSYKCLYQELLARCQLSH